MSPDERPNDEDLVRRIAAGDRASFERLFHAYHRRLFGFLVRMVRNDALADELTSDVLVDVWKGASRFKGASRVSTWIFGIARHKALSALRRPVGAVGDVDEAGEIPDPAMLADEAIAAADLQLAVRTALDQLSDEHREVMDLTFYQGFSYPEIAEIVGCPVNTVKTRMFYARRQLKTLLAQVESNDT